MVSYDDKRNFYRMMLNTEVSVTVVDDESNTKVIATCRDLSATGVALEFPHPIEIGTQVRVYVESANNKVSALDLQGRVIRITEEGPDCFLVGVAIDELD